MDETSIYLDCPPRYTYAAKGTKRVKVDTHGGEMARMSAAFTASADGSKLPILILVPRASDLPDYTPPDNVIVIYKTGATFNEDVVCEYLDKVLGKSQNSLLIWDSARCHLTPKVVEKRRELQLSSVVIPPRLTNLLQPADVCWFASIKRVKSSIMYVFS